MLYKNCVNNKQTKIDIVLADSIFLEVPHIYKLLKFIVRKSQTVSQKGRVKSHTWGFFNWILPGFFGIEYIKIGYPSSLSWFKNDWHSQSQKVD